MIAMQQTVDDMDFITARKQLLVDGKRARDAETGLLNMQLNRLRLSDVGEDGGEILTGAADDLRIWRQP